MKQERLMVFLDYQNAYHGARSAFFGTDAPAFRGQVQPRLLGMRLRQKNGVSRILVGVLAYRGMPSSRHDPKGFGAAQRQVASWERSGLVQAWTRPLNYRELKRPREKGVDVKLAVDMAANAIRDAFDIAVLVSDDTDFGPAVETVMEIKESASACEVATWVPDDGRRATPLRLPHHHLWVHRLGRGDYTNVEDVTDYTRQSRRR